MEIPEKRLKVDPQVGAEDEEHQIRLIEVVNENEEVVVAPPPIIDDDDNGDEEDEQEQEEEEEEEKEEEEEEEKDEDLENNLENSSEEEGIGSTSPEQQVNNVQVEEQHQDGSEHDSDDYTSFSSDEGDLRTVRGLFHESPSQRACIEGPNAPVQLLQISAAEAKIDSMSREFSRLVTGLYDKAAEAERRPDPNPNQGGHLPRRRLVRNEYYDPNVLFPELIWRQVLLEEISDLNLLYTIMQQNDFFRNLLQPRREEIMLCRNLPSLWFNIYCRKEEMKTVLNQYPVAVHQFFLNHSSMRPYKKRPAYIEEFGFINPLKHYGWIASFDFREIGHVSPIRLPTVGTERYQQSPFLGDQLYLTPRMNHQEGDAEDIQMWETVHHFMQLHGNHVKYLSLGLDEEPRDGYSQHAAKFILHQLPTVLPKLRRLAISFCFENVEFQPGMFPVGPAAVLPSLESLEVRCSFEYPNMCNKCPESLVLQNLVTTYHEQLEKLHVAANVWIRIASQVDWPNLKELSLDGITNSFYFHHLRPCIRMANLKKISIEGKLSQLDTVEACLAMLREIVDRSATLDTICLGGVWLELLTWSLDMAKIFPSRLQTLIIDLAPHPFPSYMFLITRFMFVQHVQIYHGEERKAPDRVTGITIRINQDPAVERYFGTLQHYDADRVLHLNRALIRGDLYTCNIWRWMYRLLTITYQHSIFTRLQYINKRS